MIKPSPGLIRGKGSTVYGPSRWRHFENQPGGGVQFHFPSSCKHNAQSLQELYSVHFTYSKDDCHPFRDFKIIKVGIFSMQATYNSIETRFLNHMQLLELLLDWRPGCMDRKIEECAVKVNVKRVNPIRLDWRKVKSFQSRVAKDTAANAQTGLPNRPPRTSSICLVDVQSSQSLNWESLQRKRRILKMFQRLLYENLRKWSRTTLLVPPGEPIILQNRLHRGKCLLRFFRHHWPYILHRIIFGTAICCKRLFCTTASAAEDCSKSWRRHKLTYRMPAAG